jgi:tRNA (cytidine/uridine-2'-O-)-methyltransferase|tara:strand:+ start:1985 stop:2485 length:501 start_codon:yes stop_codon:yes gene_type:complete
MPFNVALVAPEIPQNSGNIIRLCANTGANLHLVEPLGFELTEHALRRASLDYKHLAIVTVHKSFEALLDSVDSTRIFATTSTATTPYNSVEFQDEDTVVFGSESRGLSESVTERFLSERQLKIPMMPANRSINLSNAVAIVLYEMWQQLDFSGAVVKTDKSPEYFS